MSLALLNTPFVMPLLSPLMETVLATSMFEAEAPPEPGPAFVIDAGDGRIDILSYMAPAAAGFALAAGDGAVTIVPTEEA